MTCTCTGSRLPAFCIASSTPPWWHLRLQKILRKFRSAVHPRRLRSVRSPAPRRRATISSNLMCPSEGSLVVGPIDPATKRGLSLVENCCAASFASLAAAILISATLSARPNSASTIASRAERVRLNHIASNAEKVRVNVPNNVRTAQHQNLVAVFLAPDNHPAWGCGVWMLVPIAPS